MNEAFERYIKFAFGIYYGGRDGGGRTRSVRYPPYPVILEASSEMGQL